MLQKKENKGLTYYEVMHGNRKIAEINTRGEAVILALQFFPYDLYLEEERDFDTLINNMNNFYYWCASRVLSLPFFPAFSTHHHEALPAAAPDF